mgnify:CR=1 FL=1
MELDDKVLIFDYFDGDKVEGMHFTGKLPSYEPDTKIYMFASHSHKDHYDMDILRLADKYPNIHYGFFEGYPYQSAIFYQSMALIPLSGTG